MSRNQGRKGLIQMDQLQSLDLYQPKYSNPKSYSKLQSNNLYDSLISTNFQGNIFPQTNLLDQIDLYLQQIDYLSYQCSEKLEPKQAKKKRGRPKKSEKIQQQYYLQQEEEFEEKVRLSSNKKRKEKRLAKGDTKNLFQFFYKQVVIFLQRSSRKQESVAKIKNLQRNRFNFFDLLNNREFQPELFQMFETRYLNREVVLSRLPIEKKIFYLKKIQIFKDVFYSRQKGAH